MQKDQSLIYSKKSEIYYDLSLGLIITSTLLAILLTYMTIDFGFIKLPGGIFSIAISFSIIGFISEVYPPDYFFRTVKILILSGILFVGTLYLMANFSSIANNESNNIFFSYIKKLYRPALADLVAGVFGYFINYKVLNFWKINAKDNSYYLRNVGSAAMGEVLYNVVWVFIVFTGVYGGYDLFRIIVSMWICKIILTGIYSIPVIFCVRYLKNFEK